MGEGVTKLVTFSGHHKYMSPYPKKEILLKKSWISIQLTNLITLSNPYRGENKYSKDCEGFGDILKISTKSCCNSYSSYQEKPETQWYIGV